MEDDRIRCKVAALEGSQHLDMMFVDIRHAEENILYPPHSVPTRLI